MSFLKAEDKPIRTLFFDPSSRWYYPLRWSLLVLLGLAIYAQTFGFNFVFDDLNFIVRNPAIRSFAHVPFILKTYPSTRLLGFYSFASNYFIGQLHPQGYHIFNFFIHLVNVGLVWATAEVLFKIAGWLPSKDRLNQEIPFIIAVLFLVHPCQTQAVTYISQRFESMATMFYIGSIYFYLCGRIASLKSHQILLFICSVGFAICGIFTKEVAVTIPLMVLAAELIFFKGNRRKIYIVLIAGGTVFLILFMKLVHTGFNIFFHFQPIPSQSHDGDIITVKDYLLTQMRVFLTFMRLLVLPVHQNLDYDYPLSTGLLYPPMTLVGVCAVGAAIFSIFKLRRKYPIIAFGLAWILITFSINLAPRANIIFEHKLYLISFGYFLVLVSTLVVIIRQRTLLVKILITLIAIMSVLSFLRNQVWKNELTLWMDITRQSPHKIRPYINLGTAYYRQSNFIRALNNYNKAIEINPGCAEAYNGRGNVYSQQDDFTQALSNYNTAIEINPGYAGAYYNRGNAYAKRGDYIQALSNYNKVIELKPDSPEVYNSRGNAYSKLGNFIQALVNYNKAIEIYPDYADAYYNRGIFYRQRGNLNQADLDFSKAEELKNKW